jgi:ubiquinone/menaquinone biosynthesis C-methylase UbiE
MAKRIPNPIYNDQTLERFRSAGTWAEKISIISELADPAFSPGQLEFLHSENPADWAAQDLILHQHGCGATVVVPSVDADQPTPTVYDIDQNFQGAYIMPRLIMDVLTTVRSIDQLNIVNVKILDIGTGRGQIIQALRNHGITAVVHGMDTPDRRPWYVLDHEYDQFIDADLRRPLPIKNNTYNIITCSNVFMQSAMHMENDPPISFDCLDEILRVLAPGGIFVFSIDRFAWVNFSHKLKHTTNIRMVQQQWGYHRDRLYMFLPSRLCIALEKI